MTRLPPQGFSQRRLEKAIYDAICSDLPIAFGDAHKIDTELFEDEFYKQTVKMFIELYELPHKQPTAQDVAKEIQLFYQNQGMSEQDAAYRADKIEDFKGLQPNTALVREALKSLKTDTTSLTTALTFAPIPNTRSELLELCNNSPYMCYDEIEKLCVDIFNATHSVVKHGQKVFVCEKSHDHKGNVLYQFYSPEHLKHFYSNLKVTYQKNGKTITQKCYELWFTNERRQAYEGVIFDPSGKAPNRFLNLWDGYAVEPVEGDNLLDRIMEHLLVVVCNGDEESFFYLLAWLAHLIQKPEEKCGVCLVLMSESKGTGKSTVNKLIEALLGQHCITVQDSEHLIGHFNAHLANKIFVTIEEAYCNGSMKDAGKLRTLITENSILLESKGKDAIKIDSYHRYMLITNNTWAVTQTVNERRFFVLRVSDVKAKDKTYFDPLYADINNPEVIGQLLNFLQNYDISGFDLRNAPKTEALQEQVRESFLPHERWLHSVIELGECEVGDNIINLEVGQFVPKADLYNCYLNYFRKIGARATQLYTDANFAKYLYGIGVVRDGGIRSYSFVSGLYEPNSGKSQKRSSFELEPLSVMREKFENHYSLK